MTQGAFPELIAHAERWLGKLERQFQMTPCSENGREMALCAIAEIMAVDNCRHLTESAVGDVRLKYFREKDKDLYRRIYNNVCCFFDIKRGIM